MSSLPLLTMALAASAILFGQPAPLPEGTHAKVMIVGTFHFEDAGLDDYKPKHRLDLLSAERQKEVAEVLDCLARFRPNKIAVEWPAEHQTALNTKFDEYLARTESSTGPNEVFQLGFRLAGRLGHKNVHAVDVRERSDFKLHYRAAD